MIDPKPHHPSPITYHPIPTLHLFPGERAALLDLLADLTPNEWAAPTICPGWSVKDVAAHLLGDDVGRLSRGRDGFANPDFATGLDISTLPGLIIAIDRQNALWVEGMRRVSPELMTELLRLTGELTADYFATLDLDAIGMPVDWAGPEPAPVWLDLAREYTERWVHQQHIRDAAGRPGLKEREWLGPVVETFVMALPRALASASADEGASLRLVITGEAGGAWTARKQGGRWILVSGSEDAATTTVTIHQEIFWRLCTKGIAREDARQDAISEGDLALADRVFETVSILA